MKFYLILWPLWLIEGSSDTTLAHKVVSKGHLRDDSPLMCPCDEDPANADSLAENALSMAQSLKNKTSLLWRIHHRATHSRDAFVASILLCGLLSAVVLAVGASNMWKDKTFLPIQQKQPVHYEHYGRKTDVLVKDLLKFRAKSLLSYNKKKFDPNSRRVRRKYKRSLKMENYLRRLESDDDDLDDVDGDEQVVFDHERLLRSSSSESEAVESSDLDFESDDLENEIGSVYSLNRQTGEWSGSKSEQSNHEGQTFSLSSAFWGLFSKAKRRHSSAHYTRVNLNEEEVNLLAEENSEDEHKLE